MIPYLSRKILMVLLLPKMVRALSNSISEKALKNPMLQSLLEVTDATNRCFNVFDPARPSDIVAKVPLHARSDAIEAISRAEKALPDWRDSTTAAQRSQVLTKWSSLLADNRDDLATIMTLESGKPLSESLGEVSYAASFLDYYAAEAVRPNGAGGGFVTPTPFSDPSGNPQGQVLSIFQAVGVTGIITPWNFPLAMITRKVGPAVAAGCTAVVKPSELTPISALALQKLAVEAGLPPGVLEIVTPDRKHTNEVGTELCNNPVVRKLSFTGSTAVGKQLMSQSASNVQKVSLELGGNAPFVVFDDADLDTAVNAAMASKFRNAGQTCVCADRFLVHSTIYDEFVQKLKAQVEKLNVGLGMDVSTSMGPMITSKALDSVDAKVQEALQLGAVREVGGKRMDSLGSNFYEPTILSDVPLESKIWSSETFGPVAAIRSFHDEDEALQLCNSLSAGLAAYFCTSDLSRVFRFSRLIESGMVGVNAGIISNCVAPFGGVKESGLGREGSALGIGEYLETKYIYIHP